MRYKDALAMSDDCMTYRITVKEYAMKYGMHATFMPKPLFGENGSGMHVHQSLAAGGRNAFYDADDQYFLSDTAKAFIAGQLRHAREIAPLFAQWVNSYKRLVPGYEAPVYLAWSRRNRSALIRVPLYHPGKEQATRAELRCPDPACNPYLCFAGMLHAGLEGIEQGYELPEPMEQNLYHLTPEERAQRGIEQLPENARRGDRDRRRVRARAADPRRAHVQALHRDQARGVGGVPRPGHSLGARPLPLDPVERSDRQPEGRPGPVSRRPKGSSTAGRLHTGWPQESPGITTTGAAGYPSITGSLASARPRACCGAPASARSPERPRSSRGASTSRAPSTR